MRGMWAGSLSLSLGLLLTNARAGEDQWRPVASPAPSSACPVVTLGRPVPAVTLGRPMPMDRAYVAGPVSPPLSTQPVQPASYGSEPLNPPSPVIRAQAPDAGPPPPSPPPSSAPGIVAPPPGAVPGPPPGAAPGIPATPNERFNCGVVIDPPPSGGGGYFKGFMGGCRDFVGNIGEAGCGRSPFQSDHGFDVMSSPVTNPFLFEDPRALTELRPIFIHQGTPLSNNIYHGGDIDFLGLQGRVALTQRLSLVVSELGFISTEPHNPGGEFFAHTGFAELRIGPKYTFYRCEQTQTIVAGGLNFDIPTGPRKVFQDTGSLSLEPYISAGQNFGRSAYGSFNALGTLGYSVATDSKRTDYIFTSFHLDYDVASLHKIYPFLEFNYFHYTDSGTARDLGFEGRDLFNFGSTGVSGHDNLTMATGLRYKFNESFQTGLGYEFPLSGHKDLLDYRVTFDIIFRF